MSLSPGDAALVDGVLARVPEVRLLWLTDAFLTVPLVCTIAYILLADLQPLTSTIRLANCLSVLYLLRS